MEKTHTRTVVVALLIMRALFGFGGGVIWYSVAAYFAQSVPQVPETGFFVGIAAVTLLNILFLHKAVARHGRVHMLLYALLAYIIFMTIAVLAGATVVGAIFMASALVCGSVSWIIFDAIIQSYSHDDDDGRVYGGMLSVGNLGVLIGPVIGGYIVAHYTITGIFVLEIILHALLMVMALIVFAHLPRLRHVVHDAPLALVRRAVRLPWFRRAYAVSWALQFFYAIMVVTVPLYLAQYGFTPQQLGVLFTMMLVPFIVIEYPAGVIADRFLGEREMLLGGIGIVVASLGVMAFAPPATFGGWAVLLIISRVGAALIESMSDIFFYKHVNAAAVGLIDVYRTAGSASLLVSSALTAAMAFFAIGAQGVFIMTAVVFLLSASIAWRMHDTPAAIDATRA